MGLSSPKTLIYRLMDLDTLILMSFFGVKLDLKLDILGNLKFGEKRCRIKDFFTRVDFDFWVVFFVGT